MIAIGADDQTALAENALQRFRSLVVRLSELLPSELLECCQWLFWSAAELAAKSHAGAGEEAAAAATGSADAVGSKGAASGTIAKARSAFERRYDDIKARVPEAIAISLRTLAMAASAHYAHCRYATGRAAAARELQRFEAAAAELAALESCLPRPWRGTPVATAPVADSLKWLAWNAAWHAANERSGFAADARRALSAHLEHSERLASLVCPDLAESCRWLCWNAAWRAANERVGYDEDATLAQVSRRAIDTHKPPNAPSPPFPLRPTPRSKGMMSVASCVSERLWLHSSSCLGRSRLTSTRQRLPGGCLRRSREDCATSPPTLPGTRPTAASARAPTPRAI